MRTQSYHYLRLCFLDRFKLAWTRCTTHPQHTVSTSWALYSNGLKGLEEFQVLLVYPPSRLHPHVHKWTQFTDYSFCGVVVKHLDLTRRSKVLNPVRISGIVWASCVTDWKNMFLMTPTNYSFLCQTSLGISQRDLVHHAHGTTLGWFSNRTEKSVDDGTCNSNNWLDQW